MPHEYEHKDKWTSQELSLIFLIYASGTVIEETERAIKERNICRANDLISEVFKLANKDKRLKKKDSFGNVLAN